MEEKTVISGKYTYERQVYIYLILMVAFSSAIANQYLAIPLVVLCILDIGSGRYILATWILFLALFSELHRNRVRTLEDSRFI